MAREEMQKWLMNLRKDISQTQHQGLWHYEQALDEIISELRKEEEIQGWIPVSERLPEEDGRYYVTRHDYVTETDFTNILWYEKGLWWNRESTGDYSVIAWMPLPKPYEEGEE